MKKLLFASLILTFICSCSKNDSTPAPAPKTHVIITKVTVVNISFTQPGGTAGWDIDGTGPDVYFKIIDTYNNILFDATSSYRFANVTPSILPIAWNMTTPFAITDFNAPRFIELFDYDFGTADEDMKYVSFKMSNYISGSDAYPSTVTNTQNGITVKLDLTWY